MENASKALMMAAGVLIGIVLLSIMAYLFTTFALTSADIHKNNEENRLNEFNSQFTAYEGKEGITIYDVVTVANLATESNIYYEFPKRDEDLTGQDYYIGVKFINSSINNYNNKRIEKGYVANRNTNNYKKQTKDYYNELIEAGLNDMINDGQTLRNYDCTVKISPTTGRVYLITFSAQN